jgi:hypothetical protein
MENHPYIYQESTNINQPISHLSAAQPHPRTAHGESAKSQNLNYRKKASHLKGTDKKMLDITSQNSNFLVNKALLIPVIKFPWAHKDSFHYFLSCSRHSETEHTCEW